MDSPGHSYSSDVVIVGAGPAGLFAISQCGTHGLRCVVIDSGEATGGQCSALYPEKPIYDIPAIKKIQASELIDSLVAQSEPYRARFVLGEKVTSIQRSDDEAFVVVTNTGRTCTAKAVILATGAGVFAPNKPPLANLEEFEGKSVHYKVDRVADYVDKTVVVAGGGDSAVDWAIVLAEVARSVTVVHRRAKFRATSESHQRMQKLVDQGKLRVAPPSQLTALHGDAGILRSVGITNTASGAASQIDAQRLLLFYGLSSDTTLSRKWGLEHVQGRIKVDPQTHMTSVKGIFAIGDASSYPGKVDLILCGFSEAAQVARAAFAIARPDESLHTRHSTDVGVPQMDESVS